MDLLGVPRNRDLLGIITSLSAKKARNKSVKRTVQTGFNSCLFTSDLNSAQGSPVQIDISTPLRQRSIEFQNIELKNTTNQQTSLSLFTEREEKNMPQLISDPTDWYQSECRKSILHLNEVSSTESKLLLQQSSIVESPEGGKTNAGSEEFALESTPKRSQQPRMRNRRRRNSSDSWLVQSDESGESSSSQLFYCQMNNKFMGSFHKGSSLPDLLWGSHRSRIKNISSESSSECLTSDASVDALKPVASPPVSNVTSRRRHNRSPSVEASNLTKFQQNRENIPPLINSKSKQQSEFLYSLFPVSADSHLLPRHPSAERFVKNFKTNREELVKRLFRIFNDTVFMKALPEDLPIRWNPRLLKTGGLCKYLRREEARTGSEKIVTRLAAIELSPKVCTTAERLRDVLLHEFCHAATWIVDGVNEGHGARWRRWAKRATSVWSKLPLVSVCHAYTIDTKYTYRCTGCGACVNRHSKSIDLLKQVCGHCKSKFELLLNTARGRRKYCRSISSTNRIERTEQTSNTVNNDRPAFAEFVRQHYKTTRQNGGRPGGKTHAQTMVELGSLFKSMKIVSAQTTN